jgi:hypothetical protein
MVKSKIRIPFSRTWPTFVCLLGSLFVHSTAQAIPVGSFSWTEQEECGLFCGAIFAVENFSTDPDFSLGELGDSFFGVVVDLQTDTGPMSLLLDDIIPPGESRQSFEDLFGVAIASAGLTLGFAVPSLPGLVQLLDPDGNIVTALTGPGLLTIDYAVDTVGPTPVPEPGVLLLMTGGLLGMALARKTKRQHRERA